MIGLLTETIGNPTPISIPFLPQRQLPDSNLHFPIAPQTWHFRQSIDYSMTANYAVLDIASRNRENFLFNIYQMGEELDRARQPRQLDADAAPRPRRAGGDVRAARRAGCRRRRRR